MVAAIHGLRETRLVRKIRIAAAQFEARDADKAYNLQRIESLAVEAESQGAELACLHECSIPGYTFLENLSHKVGVVLLVLGGMHFFNMYVFARLRRRARLGEMPPPVTPATTLEELAAAEKPKTANT